MELEKRGTGREEVEEYLLNYGIEKGGLMNYLRGVFSHYPSVDVGPTSELCLPSVNKRSAKFYRERVCIKENRPRESFTLEDIMVISRERLPAEKLYGLIKTYYEKSCRLPLEGSDESYGILSFSDGKRKVHVTLLESNDGWNYITYIISERLF